MKTLAQALQAQTLSHIKMCLVLFASPAPVIFIKVVLLSQLNPKRILSRTSPIRSLVTRYYEQQDK